MAKNHSHPSLVLLLLIVSSSIVGNTISGQARHLLESATLPDVPKPEIPLPKPETAELPKPKIPELPKPEIPQLPKPEIPQLPKPELPPTLPKPEFPKLPELPKPAHIAASAQIPLI